MEWMEITEDLDHLATMEILVQMALLENQGLKEHLEMIQPKRLEKQERRDPLVQLVHKEIKVVTVKMQKMEMLVPLDQLDHLVQMEKLVIWVVQVFKGQ